MQTKKQKNGLKNANCKNKKIHAKHKPKSKNRKRFYGANSLEKQKKNVFIPERSK
jgi:hypothetical protein